jgi:hypothetical protein
MAESFYGVNSPIYVITEICRMIVLSLVDHFFQVFVVSVGEPRGHRSQDDGANDDDGVIKHI